MAFDHRTTRAPKQVALLGFRLARGTPGERTESRVGTCGVPLPMYNQPVSGQALAVDWEAVQSPFPFQGEPCLPVNRSGGARPSLSGAWQACCFRLPRTAPFRIALQGSLGFRVLLFSILPCCSTAGHLDSAGLSPLRRQPRPADRCLSRFHSAPPLNSRAIRYRRAGTLYPVESPRCTGRCGAGRRHTVDFAVTSVLG
jgi:hypothetical protein